MTPLRKAVEDYIALRRAMGFKFSQQAGELRGYADFAKSEHARHITTDLALRWAKRPVDAEPGRWQQRLGVVRQFAQFLSMSDPHAQVPPPDLLSGSYRRKPPYVYSISELQRLVSAAQRVHSKTRLDAANHSTLISLLWVTGLRPGEAIRLDDSDFDDTDGVLTIRESKFNKSRLVPLHVSTLRALRRYVRLRNRLCPRRSTSALFIDDEGRRLVIGKVQSVFRNLLQEAAVSAPPGRRSPRLLDFRHTLAVRTLIRWYRQGVDVEQRLPALSTFLGHTHVRDTYWYLSAVPELMRLAAKRLRATR